MWYTIFKVPCGYSVCRVTAADAERFTDADLAWFKRPIKDGQ